MVRLILTTALVLIGALSIAEAEEVNCTIIGDLAEKVMSMRQKETPMSSMMAAVPEGSEAFRAIIIDAYEQPSFSTPDNQQGAIAEFRNEWELQCYKMGQ